jgi:hypothetical protein
MEVSHVARTDDEVIDELRKIYVEEYGGKERQRFLISWADLRSLYGSAKLFESRFERLAERAAERGFYLWDLGEGANGRLVAVIAVRTIDRWRKVPRRVVQEHQPPIVDASDPEADEDDN